MIKLRNTETEMNSKKREILIDDLKLYITLLNFNYVNILNNLINLKSYIINYNDMLINFIVYILNLIIIYDKKESIHKIITHICSIISEYIIISFEEKNKNSNYVFKIFDCFMFGLRKMYELYFNDICLNSSLNSNNLLKSKYYSNLLPKNLSNISFKSDINDEIYSDKSNNNFNELFNEFENELVEEYNNISGSDITINSSPTQNLGNIYNHNLPSVLNSSNSNNSGSSGSSDSSDSSTSICENYITNNNIIFNSSNINETNIRYLKLYSELYKINIHSILITNYEIINSNNEIEDCGDNDCGDNSTNYSVDYKDDFNITDFLESNVSIFNSSSSSSNSSSSSTSTTTISSNNGISENTNTKNYLDRFSKSYITVNNYLDTNIDIVNTLVKYIIFNIVIKYNIDITEYRLIKLYKYINSYICKKYYKKCDYKNIINKLINCNIVFILYLQNTICKNCTYETNRLFIQNFKFIDSELENYHNKYTSVIINNKNIKIEDILLELQPELKEYNLDNNSYHDLTTSTTTNSELRNLLHNYPL
jgi:hypothetical protein